MKHESRCLPLPLYSTHSLPHPTFLSRVCVISSRHGFHAWTAQDPDAADSLRHAVSRVTELTRAGGFFIDEYLALSVVEWAVGGILQEIPRLLPVAQTTVRFLFIAQRRMRLIC